MTIFFFSLVIYCSEWIPRLSKVFFLHVTIQVCCVCVCICACAHTCAYVCSWAYNMLVHLHLLEMKGYAFIHINAAWLVNKRVNNVMLIKRIRSNLK